MRFILLNKEKIFVFIDWASYVMMIVIFPNIFLIILVLSIQIYINQDNILVKFFAILIFILDFGIFLFILFFGKVEELQFCMYYIVRYFIGKIQEHMYQKIPIFQLSKNIEEIIYEFDGRLKMMKMLQNTKLPERKQHTRFFKIMDLEFQAMNAFDQVYFDRYYCVCQL